MICCIYPKCPCSISVICSFCRCICLPTWLNIVLTTWISPRWELNSIYSTACICNPCNCYIISCRCNICNWCTCMCWCCFIYITYGNSLNRSISCLVFRINRIRSICWNLEAIAIKVCSISVFEVSYILITWSIFSNMNICSCCIRAWNYSPVQSINI